MAVKVGINGFGRIGRLVSRTLGQGHPILQLAAVNSRSDSFQKAHLLKYDSVHGVYDQDVGHSEQHITINGRPIVSLRESSPHDINWKDLGVDLVFETSGKFRSAMECDVHLHNGARKVIIGAPGKEIDGTYVMGVNHTEYDPEKCQVISNASCTTNCLAPVAKVLNDAFGIEYGMMNTIHSYTMSQRILDGSSKDIRRARAAALSMIPTSTGAAKAVTEVIPELKGRLDGFSVRVPTPNVSMVDLTCTFKRDVTPDKINHALQEAAQGYLSGILQVTYEPLVSVDYVSCTYSAVVDAPLTQVMGGKLAKVLCWYDNEMGFANRLVELAAYVADRL